MASKNKKPEDQKFEILCNAKFGRYLVAARDVSAGEIVLEDMPYAVGPPAQGPPLCLNCLSLLLPHKLYTCKTCSAPLCDQNCEKSPTHSSECQTLKNVSGILKWVTHGDMAESRILEFVLPMRCLRRLQGSPEAEKVVMEMEAHLDKRKDGPVWIHNRDQLTPVLKRVGVVQDGEEDKVQIICGVLDANASEVRGPNVEGQTEGPPVRALYPRASLMAHSCIGNVQVSVDPTFRLRARARLQIKKGNLLLVNYTRELDTTPQRQQFLREGKYLNCECSRCSDPTEMGTYVSAIRCTKCRTGFVLPPTPFKTTQEWKCEKSCRGTMSQQIMKTLAVNVQMSIENCGPNSEALEKLLTKLQRSLHPQHSCLLELRQILLRVYADKSRQSEFPNPSDLLRQTQLCRELLAVANVLDPGISRFRGVLLHELQGPMVMMAHMSRKKGEITKSELKAKLKEAEVLLTECTRLLLYEPLGTPEAYLARAALEDLRQLRAHIKKLK